LITYIDIDHIFLEIIEILISDDSKITL